DVHEPWHMPETQVFPCALQSVPLAHCPFAPQLWAMLPLHCTCPGAHRPWHEPATHVWLTQALATLHWPLDVHVSGELPLHDLAPATQTPMHDAVAGSQVLFIGVQSVPTVH